MYFFHVLNPINIAILSISFLELVSTFEKISGVGIPYEIVSRREGDIAESWSSPEKANKYLNWSAKRELETMLEDAWRWQLKNPNGYKS